MSSPAGEYLPPLVTQLLGDASDLLGAFAKAEAAERAFGKSTDKLGDDFTKNSRKMGAETSEFERLITSRMHKGETAVAALRREMIKTESEVTRLRKSMAKSSGDDKTLFTQLREAQRDLEKLRGIAQALAPDLEMVTGAAKGVGSAAASSGPGMLIMVAAVAAMLTPALAVAAALADLAGFLVLIPPAIAVALAAVIPMVVAFHNFGDAISAVASGDIDKINEALKKLSPSARSVVKEFAKLLPQLRELQRSTQESFFQPLRGVLTLLVRNLLPTLRLGLGNVASALGEVASKFLIFMSQPKQVAMLNRLFAATTRILREWMDVLPAVFGGLGKAVDALLPAFEGINKWLAGAVKSFGDWLGKAAESGQLQAWLDDALATLREVWDLIKALGGVVGTLFGEFDDSGRDTIQTLTDLVNKWDAWLKSVEGQKELEHAKEALGGLLSGLLAFAHMIGVVVHAAITFKDFIVGIPGWISATAASIGSAVGRFFASIGSWFANLGKTIWTWLTDVWGDITDWFGKVGAWFAALPGKIGTWLAALPGKLSDAFWAAVHRALYIMGFLLGSVVRFFAELPGRIASYVTATWTFITTKFREGVAASVAFVQTLPGRIATFFSELWRSVTAWVARTWSSVVAWFKRTRDDMVAWIGRAVDAVIAWFRSLPGRVVTEVTKLKDRVLAFFKGAKTWLVNAGKDIVHGVIQGVMDAKDWAMDKIRSFAHDIVKGFKDALHISSPSKLFAQFGEFTVAGFVDGVDRTAYRAAQAVADMLGRATPPTLAIAGSVGVSPAMASARTATVGGRGGYDGPATVETTLNIDGQAFIRATTPAAQRRKARSGQTGLS